MTCIYKKSSSKFQGPHGNYYCNDVVLGVLLKVE